MTTRRFEISSGSLRGGAARSVLAAALLNAVAALPAVAQQAAGPVEIETVIVTGTKRSEAQLEAPAAISVVGGRTIEALGISEVSDLAAQISSLQVTETPGVTSVFIRGIGSNIPGGLFGAGVATYVDGVYQPHPASADIHQADLERIEVLRGPQGTLYGRNATGGVVNFISRAPAAKVEGYLTAGYASFDEISLKGMLNVPMGDKVRSRLVVNYIDRSEPFLTNPLGGPGADTERSFAARLKTTIDVSETVSLDLNIFGVDERQSPYSIPTGPSGLLTLFGQVFPDGERETTQNRKGRLERTVFGADAALKIDLGIGTLTSLTSYVRNKPIRGPLDNDTTNVDYAFTGGAGSGFLSKTFIQQFELAGQSGKLNWLGGVFYMHDDADQNFDVQLPLFGIGIVSEQEQVTKSYAGFVDLVYEVSDEVSLLGGFRHSRDELKVRSSTTIAGVTDSCSTLEPSFDSNTWRVGAQYKPNSQTNLYATVTRGFKEGGVNSCTDFFEPEKVTSYELGYKARLLDGRLTLGAAAFYYDYTGLQVFHVDAINLTSSFENAAEATLKGLELEAVWRPDRHWTLNLGLTLLDAQYDEYRNFDALNPAAGEQDLSGNPLNSAPDAVLNLGIQYQMYMGDLGTLTARLEGRYSDRVFFREWGNRLDSQGAYSTGNAYLIWESGDEKLGARLYAKNFTDTVYFQSLGGVGDPLFYRVVTLGAPRQVGVELTYRF